MIVDRTAAQRREGLTGVLRRLARDRRGNTLAIVGAALIPLTAMIGSGVDMSRAYMAKARLQSACDAAALAGRRVMVNDQMSANVTNEARRFFNFNFAQNLYQTASFTPAVSRPSSGTVRVSASTSIPTSIMHLFGYESLPLSVTCDASLNYVNTDVMLVLDTTGSMLCTPEESGSCGRSSEISTSRIVALREATMALYDALAPTQTQLQAAGMRLRYGVVPYSSSVNVGHLIRAVNSGYLADSVTYPSRVLNYNTAATPIANAPTTAAPVQEVYNNGASINQTQCRDWGRNYSNPPVAGGGPAPQPTTSTSYSNNQTGGVDWGYPGAPDTTTTSRSCRRWRTVTTTTYRVPYRYTNDRFEQVALDTSQFKLGNAVTIATGQNDGDSGDFSGTVPTSGTLNLQQLAATASGVGTTSTTWNGCIMERGTVSTITSWSGFTIPTDAYDLNINHIPNSEETRWRPMWPQVVYRRSGGSSTATSGTAMTSQGASSYACPTEAKRLQAFTRTQMQTYVDSLDAIGGTYHDIGMIWGGRLISNAGIFADSPNTFNGQPVSRHIIFMTDGELAPNCNSYTSYGVEQNDMRVTGGGSCPQQDERHLQRFRMICNAIKGMNVSIWVIVFGSDQTLPASMTECASNPDQAALAVNRTQLIAKFTQIGQNIGALRLTQ